MQQAGSAPSTRITRDNAVDCNLYGFTTSTFPDFSTANALKINDNIAAESSLTKVSESGEGWFEKKGGWKTVSLFVSVLFVIQMELDGEFFLFFCFNVFSHFRLILLEGNQVKDENCFQLHCFGGRIYYYVTVDGA